MTWKIFSVKLNSSETKLLSQVLQCLPNGIDWRRHLKCRRAEVVCVSGRSFECLSGSIFGQRTIQGQASGELVKKNLRQKCRLVKDLRAGKVWGAAQRAAFYSACEGLNKIRQKTSPPEHLEPFQEAKQHPRFTRQTSLLHFDLQQTALFDAE